MAAAASGQATKRMIERQMSATKSVSPERQIARSASKTPGTMAQKAAMMVLCKNDKVPSPDLKPN